MATEEQDIKAFVKELEPGRIYFIAYGANTNLVVRYKKQDITQLYFFSELHYWNGSERFNGTGNAYSCRSGITEIREATKPEKHNLFRHETDSNTL
jgi:hypothetical protein